MKKEHFNVNEWKTSEILVKLKNKNIIDYDCVNEIKVYNEEYIVFMLEYANSGVLFIYNLILFLLKDLSCYLKFERNSENIKKIEHVLYDFVKQICFLFYIIYCYISDRFESYP
jgi:hypothetical protein